MSYDDVNFGRWAYDDLSHAEIEAMARRLVARESPAANEEHFESLVKSLLAKYYRTGNCLDWCWRNM
jgi:hypothetical protein